MSDEKIDELFCHVMRDCNNIVDFFNHLFGFLYRKTDFYEIQNNIDENLGLPPNAAETLVQRAFKAWESKAKRDQQSRGISPNHNQYEDMAPNAIEEIEVETEMPEEIITETSEHENNQSELKDKVKKSIVGDAYNGAKYDGYSWSQSLSDIIITINVPDNIKKGNQVEVNYTSKDICVKCQDTKLIEGQFQFDILKNNIYWTLEAGKYIQIFIDKREKRWWSKLLTTEPEIDTSKIDSSVPTDELSEFDQIKISQILNSNSEQSTNNILKEAWNKEGSPFQGTDFDPSIVQIHKPNAQIQ